jgi:hypothetical protein
MWDDQWHLHGHTYSLDVEKLWAQGTHDHPPTLFISLSPPHLSHV